MSNVVRVGSPEWWEKKNAETVRIEAEATAREAAIAALPPFDRFWAHVPTRLKKDKRACVRKFAAITSKDGCPVRVKDGDRYESDHLHATADEIIDGWRRYIARQTDREGTLDKYTRDPLTWLNRGMYEDD